MRSLAIRKATVATGLTSAATTANMQTAMAAPGITARVVTARIHTVTDQLVRRATIGTGRAAIVRITNAVPMSPAATETAATAPSIAPQTVRHTARGATIARPHPGIIALDGVMNRVATPVEIASASAPRSAGRASGTSAPAAEEPFRRGPASRDISTPPLPCRGER